MGKVSNGSSTSRSSRWKGVVKNGGKRETGEAQGEEEIVERGRGTGRVLNRASDINFPLTVGR